MASLNKKFYVNFLNAQDNKVFLRGTFVDASSTTIKTFHRTRHYTPDFYENLQDGEVHYDEIINILTEGRGT
ncbi:hypothetical protein ES288_A07G145500v1 [Gossypium darwinii]|uniref:Uncharacterized protein n=1 Tax=Gossypium darwinii TaxID=34276 RepID=A0A5D2FWM8_GOSDA|nr:hypothetical protein ES288_A07G145500v1 [Gossypium darwinii]